MTELDDHELLAEFARNGSEDAFAAIVARHVNLVYSTGLRYAGNPHHAEEITQAVFIILARKAGSLGSKVVLSGWLYQATRLTAANFVKGEIRRQQREQEAYVQSTLNETTAPAWEQLAPLLDEAMGGLNEMDRAAMVLRFFENKTAAEVAAVMNTTEAAAHKRTNRALEKLRKIFSKRGMTLSAVFIASAVSANSVQAAPGGLAAHVTTTVTNGAGLGASTLGLVNGALKVMAWAKIKFTLGIGAGVVLLAATTAMVFTHNPGDPVDDVLAIVSQSAARYASLRSYSCSGTTRQEVGGNQLAGAFSMRLAKPGLFRLEYIFCGPGLTNKGVAWRSGRSDFFVNQVIGETNQWDDTEIFRSFGMLGDVTGGATLVVPAMFFQFQPRDNTALNRASGAFSATRGARLKREADETVNQMDCFVVSAETATEKTSLWICKHCWLVQQMQQRLNIGEPGETVYTQTHDTAVLNQRFFSDDFSK